MRWLTLTISLMAWAQAPAPDWRNIANGPVIPDEGYADQPYIVKAADGAWVCVITTGPGSEGQGGQHVVSLRSADQGRSWSTPVDVEPETGPEASWAVPLVTPSGRIFVFYTYNRDNIRRVPDVESESLARRVDTLGVMAFRYSDDNGRSWSKDRHEIPLRTIQADRDNNFGGRALLFWSVGKPLVDRGEVFIGFAKVTRWGSPGTLRRSRGFLLKSANVLTETDVSKIRWEMLPEGDDGLTAPKGPISEETNITALSDGTLYALYRTIDGYLCHAYSYDRGKSWTAPAYATYSSGGRPIKHPRAFAFARRFANGRFLLWFHNHGGEAAIARERWDPYRDRNPGWVMAGEERNGRIWWSQPEILLYDSDPATRISYPDFVEEDGTIWITETQKTVARTHRIDDGFLEKLFSQFSARVRTDADVLLEAIMPKPGELLSLPEFPVLDAGKGFTLDFWMRTPDLYPGAVLLDTRDSSGRGLMLGLGDRSNLKLTLADGNTSSEWESDPGTHDGTLRVNQWHHVSATVDARARIITWTIDGVLNDGGAARQFGWGRLDPSVRNINGRREAVFAPRFSGEISRFRIYRRPLMVSESVGNYRAGR